MNISDLEKLRLSVVVVLASAYFILSFSMQFNSKLPNVGITIFTKMSKMANEHDAINLSQGFPDFSVDPVLIEKVDYYMRKGVNQYAPMREFLSSEEAIVKKTEVCYDWKPHIDKNITVTCGAIEAIMSAISALTHLGDE